VTRLNWERANARKRQLDADRTAGKPSTRDPALPYLNKARKKSRKKLPGAISRSRNFPALVTRDAGDGTLELLTFNTRADADASGFGWVGRDRGGPPA
jgi:hypothetical protein